MKLSEIMTTAVEVIHPDDSLQEAARKMRDRDIGLLPVCDGQKLIGMLSDRDITIRAMAEGMQPTDRVGRDLATYPVIYCYEDEDVNEAAKIMNKNQIRRLAILRRKDKQLCGMVALGDLAVNTDDKLSGDVLQKVSEPVNMAS
ncbi:MAG: CBS domain-containing protein [Chloroflexota bacterium]